jgi:hypothetical protein
MKIIFILALLLSSCSCTVAQKKNTARVAKKNVSSSPQPQAAQSFFSEIIKREKLSGLSDLRSVNLPPDDLEIRVWRGFDLTYLQGLVIKRASGQWSAIRVQSLPPGLPRGKYQKQLSMPKSGWEAMWRRLTNEGIVTLVDASDVGCDENDPDATSYVVEINANQKYRTYHYTEPEYSECDEAKQMVRINKILTDEFVAGN